MPVRKGPGPGDGATARRILLGGLARDADIFGIVGELAPLHPRNNTFPGEVFLEVAADALDWAGASRADPVSLEGFRERYARPRDPSQVRPSGPAGGRPAGLVAGSSYPRSEVPGWA